MSGGIKRVAQLDSQNLKHLAQDWNIGPLEQEAAKNEKNPGRAITKAGAYALGGYLGGLLGGAGEAAAGAGEAGAAATDAAIAGGSALSEQAVTAAIEQQIAAQSAQYAEKGAFEAVKDAFSQGTNSIKDGWNSVKGAGQGLLKGYQSGVDKALYQAVPGAGSQQAGLLAQQTGDFGIDGLMKTMSAAGKAEGLSGAQQFAADTAGKFGGLLSKDPSKAVKAYQAFNAMNPQQPPEQSPIAPPPRQQQAQAEPLASPYGPNGNSMGLLSFDELEKKRRLRAMGYRV